MPKTPRSQILSVGQLRSRLDGYLGPSELPESTPEVFPVPDAGELAAQLYEEAGVAATGRAKPALTRPPREGRGKPPPSPPAPTTSKLEKSDIDEFRDSIVVGVIRPTIRTEFAAAAVGIVFYLGLAVAGYLAVIIGNTSYTTLGTLAVGTGGAVAYLQPFQTNVTQWLRTRRSLLNIENAWVLEDDAGSTEVTKAAIQMRDFLDQVTKMPAPYAASSNSSK